MLLLTSTSDLVTVITDAAADIETHASWTDKVAATEPVAGRTNTASITTATTTTVVGSPGASTTRNVKHLSFHNNHATISCLLRIVHTDGTTTEEMIHATLLPGETLIFDQTGMWSHYDGNGAKYADNLPYLDASLGVLNCQAETIPRQICTETNTSALASGTLFMQAIYLRRGQIVANISFFSATSAASGPTHGLFGLYNNSRDLLASSADFTSEAWAANSIKTKAMTTPYTVLTSGLYYLAIMCTASTNVPTLKGNTAITGAQLAGTAPILHGTADAGLTTTLPNPAAAITVGTTTVWGAAT
jgi:hypothetical protein